MARRRRQRLLGIPRDQVFPGVHLQPRRCLEKDLSPTEPLELLRCSRAALPRLWPEAIPLGEGRAPIPQNRVEVRYRQYEPVDGISLLWRLQSSPCVVELLRPLAIL